MYRMVRDLWAYRQFILSSIRNELVNRFARSKFGGLWLIINPLSQVAIYALILSNVLAAKLPGIESKYSYAIYLMAGLLAWTLFNEIVVRCLNLFIEQANLIKKVRFPQITLPAIVIGSNLLNNAFLLVAMLGIFLFLGHSFSLSMLWLLPLALTLIGFAVGLGLVLGIVNVFVRDLGQIVPIILQIWFWLTPIVYPESIIPEGYRHWLALNPIYHFTSAYHQVLVYGKNPEVDGLLVVGTLSLLLLLLALFLFRRSSEEIVDFL